MERKGPIAKVGGGFAFTKLDCSNKASPVFFFDSHQRTGISGHQQGGILVCSKVGM
jgi:hypothetical protein